MATGFFDGVMADHLRFAVAYWHSFAWEGQDPFGGQTFQRPWHPQDDMDNLRTLNEITDYLGEKMDASNTGLLWGTANMFSDRRWMSGASTNPDPDVFAFAAATVKSCMDATHKLGGENYVLWGGREGYETLLNTDMGQELDHMGRFLSMVVDYKHKIGFRGQILVEPKPQEPSKHQYDFDAATCIGFISLAGTRISSPTTSPKSRSPTIISLRLVALAKAAQTLTPSCAANRWMHKT